MPPILHSAACLSPSWAPRRPAGERAARHLTLGPPRRCQISCLVDRSGGRQVVGAGDRRGLHSKMCIVVSARATSQLVRVTTSRQADQGRAARHLTLGPPRRCQISCLVDRSGGRQVVGAGDRRGSLPRCTSLCLRDGSSASSTAFRWVYRSGFGTGSPVPTTECPGGTHQRPVRPRHIARRRSFPGMQRWFLLAVGLRRAALGRKARRGPGP